MRYNGNDINNIWNILASNDWIRIWTYYNEKNWHTYNVYASREDWIRAAKQLLHWSKYWGKTLWQCAETRTWTSAAGAKDVITSKWLSLNDKLTESNIDKFVEAIWQWEWNLKWQSTSSWASQWRSIQTPSQEQTTFWYWENPMSANFNKLSSGDLNADQKKDLKFVNQSYWLLYRLASSWDLEHFLQSGDYEKVVEALNTQAFQNIEWNHTFSYIKSMITKNISDPTNLKVVWDLAELVTLKLRKESWAAISAWEWQSWFESFLPWAWEPYSVSFAKYQRFEQDYLMPSYNYAWGTNQTYKSLFSEWSKYYNKDIQLQSTPKYTIWAINAPSYVSKTLDLWGGIDYDSLWNKYSNK